MGADGGRASNSVAIVGMSCIFPGAASLNLFWENITGGFDAVREPRSQEWSASFYRDKPESAFGRIYCSKAGFITEHAQFDPLEFGIMPASLKGSDPDQFLALRVAAEALRDAGYDCKTFDGERAEIVIGRTMAPGVGSLNLIQHGQTVDQIMDVVRAVAPRLGCAELEAIAERLHGGLQPCNADTIPAVMPNVLSGRIAGKLGFRGRNFVLDAACASSLIAVEMTMQSLISGQADLAIAGGVHVNSSPYFSQMFCELGALSPSGTIRPFDDEADGTILGEGVGMVVLKRLADAEKDGNRIYAVIRGIGSASDGRGGGSLAPSIEGEALAMKRAYEMAGISPRTVGLLEAHGTGTRAGDRAEMKAVEQVFADSQENSSHWCALGSVKSMIGHTQAASGMAGLIKVALALHHKTLPQTLHFSKPNTQIDWSKSPCYMMTETRPWPEPKIEEEPGRPRRAAVSSFGFGGINAHAVLEEYPAGPAARSVEPARLPAGTTARMVNLSLGYPALTAEALKGLKLESGLAPLALPAPAAAPAPLSAERKSAAAQTLTADRNAVLRAYIETLDTFHQNALGVQERVMLSYLNCEATTQTRQPRKPEDSAGQIS
jgi:acyl transferase domain-containing protein